MDNIRAFMNQQKTTGPKEDQIHPSDKDYDQLYVFMQQNFEGLQKDPDLLLSVYSDRDKVTKLLKYLSENANQLQYLPSEGWASRRENNFVCGWLDFEEDPFCLFLGKEAVQLLKKSRAKPLAWNPLFLAMVFGANTNDKQQVFDLVSFAPKVKDSTNEDGYKISCGVQTYEDVFLLWATQLRMDQCLDIADLWANRNSVKSNTKMEETDKKTYRVLEWLCGSDDNIREHYNGEFRPKKILPNLVDWPSLQHIGLYAKLCYLELHHTSIYSLLRCRLDPIVLPSQDYPLPWIRFKERALGLTDAMAKLIKPKDRLATKPSQIIGEAWVFECSKLGNDPVKRITLKAFERFEHPVCAYRNVIDSFKKAWSLVGKYNGQSARFAAEAIGHVFPVDYYVRKNGQTPLVMRGTPCLENLYKTAASAFAEDKLLNECFVNYVKQDLDMKTFARETNFRLYAHPYFDYEEAPDKVYYEAVGFIDDDDYFMRLSPWQVLEEVEILSKDAKCWISKDSLIKVDRLRETVLVDVDLSSGYASNFLSWMDTSVPEHIKIKALILDAIESSLIERDRYGKLCSDEKKRREKKTDCKGNPYVARILNDEQIRLLDKDLKITPCKSNQDVLKYEGDLSAMAWVLSKTRGGLCVNIEWNGYERIPEWSEIYDEGSFAEKSLEDLVSEDLDKEYEEAYESEYTEEEEEENVSITGEAWTRVKGLWKNPRVRRPIITLVVAGSILLLADYGPVASVINEYLPEGLWTSFSNTITAASSYLPVNLTTENMISTVKSFLESIGLTGDRIDSVTNFSSNLLEQGMVALNYVLYDNPLSQTVGWLFSWIYTVVKFPVGLGIRGYGQMMEGIHGANASPVGSYLSSATDYINNNVFEIYAERSPAHWLSKLFMFVGSSPNHSIQAAFGSLQLGVACFLIWILLTILNFTTFILRLVSVPVNLSLSLLLIFLRFCRTTTLWILKPEKPEQQKKKVPIKRTPFK